MIPGTPGPYSQPSPIGSPGIQPNSATTKTISKAGYWIALAIFIFGCGGAAVWFAFSVGNVISMPENYKRTTIPGAIADYFEKGEYTIYYEYPVGLSDAFTVPAVDVWRGDVPVALDMAFLSSSYTRNGKRGTSIAKFHVDTPGVYRIGVFGEPQPEWFRVAVGRETISSAFVSIFGSLALGGGSTLIAAVIFIVTAVRRNREKRGNQPTLPPYQPPYGGLYGGQYGGPIHPMPEGINQGPYAQPGNPNVQPPSGTYPQWNAPQGQPFPGPHSPDGPPPGVWPPPTDSNTPREF